MARGATKHRRHVLGGVAVLVLVLAEVQLWPSGLGRGTMYWFSVGSTDPADHGSVHDVDRSRDPAGVVADSGDTRVDLTWEPVAAGDLVGYRVYRSTDEGGPWTLLNFTPQVDTTDADTSLDNGTEYFYLVTAVDDDQDESPGAPISATPGGTTPPDPHRGVTAVPGDRSDAVTTVSRPAIEPRTMAATHACRVDSDGSLWCWGEHVRSQLGLGGTQADTPPARIGTSLEWAEVAVGVRSTCAVRIDRSLWCWGRGMGTSRPHRVGADEDWTAVDVGETHGCALRRDLSLWCWGANEDGRLGDGTTTARPVPSRVGAANDWASVSAGVTNTCGTRLDGSLWCWGRNLSGILEAGTAERTVSRPLRIGAASTWASVSVGTHDICGTRAEGTLWCWGLNGYGVAGDGGTGLRLGPGQVGSDTDWVDVSVGWLHACGVRTDGSAWCWGLNHAGQLGDRSTVTRPNPVAAGSPEREWVDVEVGAEFTCGTLLDGSTRCWGDTDGPAAEGRQG